MCRLYGLHATHETKISCELLEAQNALIRQSEEDARGLSNPHGWGIGWIEGGHAYCEREVDPASTDEDFRQDAADVEATTAIAHIRRATVGNPRLENTHPFRSEDAMLAHNGHIPAFDQVRERMLANMLPRHRDDLRGETDSEHFFRLLLSNRDRREELSRPQVLRHTAHQVVTWAGEVAPGEEIALNFLWSCGDDLVGMRMGRSLWYMELRELHRCSICGRPHAHPVEDEAYHSVEFASERITDEAWVQVPEDVVFHIDDDLHVVFEPLQLTGAESTALHGSR